MHSQELKIKYPCLWEYKTVVEADACIKTATKDILRERDHKIKLSKSSKAGKYTSYTISILVHNDDDRKMLFECLKKHDKIKFVL
ncbi:MAG: DUF493 domain-containing protein [Sulfurospirillum sp.]|nr:DUF493 domain-containing protein [Sulfurospirillum sp.]